VNNGGGSIRVLQYREAGFLVGGVIVVRDGDDLTHRRTVDEPLRVE